MKLLFLSSGRSTPSSRFRIQPFAAKLRECGHQCKIAHSIPGMYDHWPWLGFRLSQRLKFWVRYIHWIKAYLVRYDAVIIERQLFNSLDGSMEQRFRKLNTIVVLDIDDAVFLHFPEKARENATNADLIFAGNASLAEWASQYNSNVVELPTCIDTELYQARSINDSESNLPVVGWMGTSSNIDHLLIVADALKDVATRHRFRLRIVSNDPEPLSRCPLEGIETEFVPWSAENETRDLANFDIGIMPLVDDEWSRYKCGAKLLQYMATAVPSIASPVGVNREIIKQGINGFKASTTDEWTSSLNRLFGDKELRIRLGLEGRKTVVEDYSLHRHLPRWIEAVEKAIRHSSDH